jgi:hypothetical protein
MRIQSRLNARMQAAAFQSLADYDVRQLAVTGEGSTMAERSRGATLTIFAILFGLLALSNFLKPVLHGGNFVFLGTKMTGVPNAILAILFGILLAAYAYGIWTMRKFALPIAYIYFPWVVLNTILFSMKNRPADPRPSPVVMAITIAIGIGVPLATLIILHRRRAELT